MKDESRKPGIKQFTQKSGDLTKRPNQGTDDLGQIVNNPMGDISGMFPSFARAIHQDFVMADTCAKKNPFKSDWYKPLGPQYVRPEDKGQV